MAENKNTGAFVTKLVWAAMVAGAYLITRWLQLSHDQSVATTVFLSLIFGTLLFWEFRLAFAFFGLATLLTFNVIDIPHVVEFASLDIILFLVGMMTIIGFLEDRKFFDQIVEKLAIWVGPKAYRFMTVMMIAAAVSAALVDEVTSIMFMMTTLLIFLKKARVSAIPFVMMIVFATNIGSSATVVGNPVGVLIAMKAHLSFFDFLRWATPISLIGVAALIPLSFLIFRKPLQELDKNLKEQHVYEHVEKIEEESEKRYGSELPLAWTIFGLTILGLVFHSQLEHLVGLPKNTLLIGVALFMAGLCLFLSGHKARDLIEKRVDWWTLAFFLILFASVGTLKYVGVTDLLAEWIVSISGGNTLFVFLLVAGVVAILTAFMDNILAVATFIPIVSSLALQGFEASPLWWGMLFGGTFFGNATLIGSTANIVAAGMMEKRGAGKFTFMVWIVPGVMVSVITLMIALALLYFQIPLMTL